MAIGKGKYDDIATAAMMATDAELVVVLIGGGALGSGFSVQCANPGTLAMLPALLRTMADEVEKDVERVAHAN